MSNNYQEQLSEIGKVVTDKLGVDASKNENIQETVTQGYANFNKLSSEDKQDFGKAVFGALKKDSEQDKSESNQESKQETTN